MAKIEGLCKVTDPENNLSVIAKNGDYYHRGIISKIDADTVKIYCVDNGTTEKIAFGQEIIDFRAHFCTIIFHLYSLQALH